MFKWRYALLGWAVWMLSDGYCQHSFSDMGVVSSRCPFVFHVAKHMNDAATIMGIIAATRLNKVINMRGD